MDIEKVITFFPQYLSEYLALLFMTLQKPSLRFAPSSPPRSGIEIIRVSGDNSNTINGATLNPKLISFAILSILFGSIIQGVTPNHPSIKEFPTLVVIVIALWLFISITVFFVCRSLGGKGSFIDTISISLQLLAVIYVVASLVSLIATIIFFANEIDFLYSYLVYLTTQIILLSIYLPLALKELHFSSNSKVSIRRVIAVVFSILSFLLIAFFSYSTAQVTLHIPSSPTITQLPTKTQP